MISFSPLVLLDTEVYMSAVVKDSLEVEEIAVEGYDKVYKVEDPSVGLVGIISLHNLTLGPALGGIRIHPYASFEDALCDVKRLSRGMTYKSALSRCAWGGGKSVIIATQQQKTEELLRSFGRAIERLGGQYIGAEDVGCGPKDVEIISKETKYVVGLESDKSSGNPSCYTAWGVYRGIQAALQKVYGSNSVAGKVVAIQGVGSVGTFLADMLFWNGAKLILSDVNMEKAEKLAKQYGAKACSPKEILSVECDIFAPCALGGILNPETIPELQCKIVAGAANNQLLFDGDGETLRARGILYAPDFVINAGGLINVSTELRPEGYNPIDARAKIDGIYQYLLSIFEEAERARCSTDKAARTIGDHLVANKIGLRTEEPCFHHHFV